MGRPVGVADRRLARINQGLLLAVARSKAAIPLSANFRPCRSFMALIGNDQSGHAAVRRLLNGEQPGFLLRPPPALRWLLIPGSAVEDSAGFLFVGSAPLLEVERDTICEALITD